MVENLSEMDRAILEMEALQTNDFLVTRLLESALLFVVLFGLARYVFLENMFQGKKGRIYYGIFLILGVVLTAFNDGVSQLLIFGSLFISMVLGREKHRWIPVLQFLPWIGLADGILIPILTIPIKVIEDDLYKAAVYKISIYSIITVLVVGFLVFGRNWRRKFEEEVSNRRLSNWERIILCITGMLQMILSTLMSMPLNEFMFENANKGFVGIMGIWLGAASFTLTIAVITMVMVSNKQAFYHNRVTDMQFNIIVMMAEIVENRDENTGGHIQRTAKYVEILARQLQEEGKFKNILTDDYIKDMIVAAPLHDIGKIHVTDTILNKPERLNEEEFQIMKTHAVEGRKLLEHAKEHLGEFSYLDVAVQMAAYHHEWVDGSSKGYPYMAKGEEIPLCARIMAVADVFDALTSKRCYKDPMPIDQAYRIILEEKGTHFDVDVVEAFVDAKEEFEEALDRFL